MARLNYDVNPNVFSKASGFRDTKLREMITEFRVSEKRFAEVVLEPNEYKSVYSAQSAYSSAVKKMKAPIKIRVIDGKLYMISTIWLEKIKGE